jgi:hypothetical protein
VSRTRPPSSRVPGRLEPPGFPPARDPDGDLQTSSSRGQAGSAAPAHGLRDLLAPGGAAADPATEISAQVGAVGAALAARVRVRARATACAAAGRRWCTTVPRPGRVSRSAGSARTPQIIRRDRPCASGRSAGRQRRAGGRAQARERGAERRATSSATARSSQSRSSGMRDGRRSRSGSASRRRRWRRGSRRAPAAEDREIAIVGACAGLTRPTPQARIEERRAGRSGCTRRSPVRGSEPARKIGAEA